MHETYYHKKGFPVNLISKLVNGLLDPDYGKEWDKNLNQTHGSLP